MKTVTEVGPRLGVRGTCEVLGVAAASYYRSLLPKLSPSPPPSPRALSAGERGEVLALLHSPRFVDQAPAQVWAALLDEGCYVCSERTMYRILAANDEVRERRNQLRHPSYAAPELMATGPNELWSWDITKLKGPAKWVYYYLYVILDVFSRYVVGWMVAAGESAALAERLIAETCERQGIEPGALTLHADRGTSMRSKSVGLLLADLGVTQTHSRPYTSTDNPFSEAQFKTLKYRPAFPERFGSIQDARGFCVEFFGWYNAEHHHTGLGLLTPVDVHHGRVEERLAGRTAVLEAAHRAHPERFPRGVPRPRPVPEAVWINKPAKSAPRPKNDLVGSHRINDLDPPRGRGTPEPEVTRSPEEVMEPATAQ